MRERTGNTAVRRSGKSLIALFAGLLIISMGYVSCAAKQRVVGVPRTFLEDVNIDKKLENLPFDHSWARPGAKKSSYGQVYFKPVRTDLLPPDAWNNSASMFITGEEDYRAEAKELAKYFREQLIDDVRSAPKKRYTVVNSAGPGVLVVEIALTELEFSHPIARAGALVAPVPGTSAALSTITDPHVAFAARLTDGKTGRLLATAADRKFPPMRIIDLNKLTVTSSAREVCALWAKSIAEVLDSNQFAEVKEKRFSILPW
jgi:hypothetical protein